MRPELRALADRQCGVITRRDAVACGYTERELKTLTGHRGAWVVLRRGCYAERALYEGCDDDRKYLLRVHAAALAATADAVVSHASAAVLLGLPLRPRWRELVHVTRDGVQGGRTEAGVKHHRASLSASDLTTLGPSGRRCTGLARTAVDIGRESGFEDGVVAADAALRLGATRTDLDGVVDGMPFWPGVVGAREAARFADGGAQTIGESLMRMAIHELGIGAPETQFKVVRGNRWAEVDVRVGRHLFEFDGRIKYLRRLQGGVADKPVEQVVWEEKQREDWLRGQCFGVSRVVWSDLFGEARQRLRVRLRQEYAQTVRLWGEDVGRAGQFP